MEIDHVRLRTYRQVWSQERVIYQIERVRLPFPVSFRQAGVFGASVAAMLVLSRIPPVAALPGLARYVLLPFAVTWFLTKQRLDGKPPLAWLVTMVRYAISPKRLNRLSPIAAVPPRLRLRGAVGYRAKG
jgi:hypothetical protein